MNQPISFEKEYLPTRFPIEARYYDLQERSPLSAQVISSPQHLQTFLEEVDRQE